MTFASAERAYLTPPEPVEDCECGRDDCTGDAVTCACDAMESDAEHRAEADRDEEGW